MTSDLEFGRGDAATRDHAPWRAILGAGPRDAAERSCTFGNEQVMLRIGPEGASGQ
jgi:hypothetical protein